MDVAGGAGWGGERMVHMVTWGRQSEGAGDLELSCLGSNSLELITLVSHLTILILCFFICKKKDHLPVRLS